jgi:murein DD-endopeptidase MepM/ murein hydrolase activator NlpD
MKTTFTSALIVLFCFFSFPSIAQDTPTGYTYSIANDTDHPCITPQQYEMIDRQVAENLKLLKLDIVEHKDALTTSLSWPLQAAAGFTDCSYYIVTAYVDENLSAGSIGDYNCGTNTYDTHKGTDICSWPFPFYKMDHSQVEVIAAAPGTIIAKDDFHFDRHCASSTDTANYVIIQHADGSCALYWHMKSGSVTSKSIGQSVVTGEYLGVVGSSGSSSGPHLHFEVWTTTVSSSYNDPYFGTCNVLNGSSWWVSQKPYTEPAILKASVHTTDAVIPGCDTTET